jgi:hypothetical protein
MARTTTATKPSQPSTNPTSRRRWLRFWPALALMLIGFVVGILWLAGVRFLTVHPAETHYHANFAVYINGQREEFKSFNYYEEIAACTTAYTDNPKGRVHMHDSVNDVVHVHDKRVTWADFFENINWSLGRDFMETDKALYQNNDQQQLMFILNGKEVPRVDNMVIGDQDKLLISYDVPTTDFMAQYDKIENKAKAVDATQDPASCSGLNGPGQESFGARLKRAFAE